MPRQQKRLRETITAPEVHSAQRALALEVQTIPRAEKKQRRKTARREMARESPGMTVLQQASVSAPCRARYGRHWKHMQHLVVDRDGFLKPPVVADQALTAYLEEQYMEGEDLATARYMIAAVLFFKPELKSKGMSKLPRVKQSLDGWQKLCPPRSRLPIPYEVVALLALWALQSGAKQIAMYLLLSFALYLRPNESLRLRKRDLVKPSTGRGGGYPHWTVVLHPLELGHSSKTQEFDECLALDLPYQAMYGQATFRLMRLAQRKADDKIFSIAVEDVHNFLKEASVKLQLQSLGELHPYRLRHGGASHDCNSKLRDVAGVQLRGRWKTLASVRRYQKGGRLSQLFKGLPKEIRKAAREAVAKLPDTLASAR